MDTKQTFFTPVLPSALALTTQLLLASPQIANAEPKISEIAGTVQIGNIVTILGSGFGEKKPAFQVQDNSREYTHIADDSILTSSSQETLWGVKGSPWATPLETKRVEASANDVYVGKAKSYNQWIAPLRGRTNQSIYVSWLFNPSESPSAAEGSNKFIRIWDHDSGENTRISWTQMHLTYLTNDLGYSPSPSWREWGGEVNAWNHLEIWVDSKNGIIEAYTNGRLIHDVSDFKKSPISDGLNVKLLGFDPNETARYSSLTFMIDDLYVSTDQARVVVSESPIWAEARASGKPQLVKNWSADEISFEFHPRMGQMKENTFLYVVDSIGRANQQGVALCLQCPSAPIITVQ